MSREEFPSITAFLNPCLSCGVLRVLPKPFPAVGENLEFPVPSLSIMWFITVSRNSMRSNMKPSWARSVALTVSCLSVLAKVRVSKTKTPTHSLLRAEGSLVYSYFISPKLPEAAEMTCELCTVLLMIFALFLVFHFPWKPPFQVVLMNCLELHIVWY